MGGNYLTYTYSDPLSRGYVKFKLSKQHHNILFKNRKKNIFDKYEYYYNKNGVVIYRFTNWIGITYLTLLFPVLAPLRGLVNLKTMLREMKELYRQKKYGNFEADGVMSGTQKYNDIMYAIKLNSR